MVRNCEPSNRPGLPKFSLVACAAKPAHVSLRSLLPIIRGEGTTKYPSIYSVYMDFQRSVMTALSEIRNTLSGES
jgi:hypothetical protein